jgi:hypothetical protein
VGCWVDGSLARSLGVALSGSLRIIYGYVYYVSTEVDVELLACAEGPSKCWRRTLNVTLTELLAGVDGVPVALP